MTESDLPFVEHDGHRRYFGVLPPTDFGNLPKFGSTFGEIPRNEWRQLSPKWPLPPTDQDGQGSCTGHGTLNAFTLLWLQTGQRYIPFSPTWAYALNNGNRDRGAVISDCVRTLQTQGICLASQLPEGRIWQSQIPADAYTTAKQFMLLDAWHVQTIADFITAVQLGFPVVFGMTVGQNFGDLDEDGCVPANPGWGRGGHCLATDGEFKFGPGEKPLIGFVNSWGVPWGLKGHAFLDPFVNLSTGEMDAYALRGCSYLAANLADLPAIG